MSMRFNKWASNWIEENILPGANSDVETHEARAKRLIGEMFAEAAEAAHKKIESMPKGMPRLEAWLGAMGQELSKRAIEV